MYLLVCRQVTYVGTVSSTVCDSTVLIIIYITLCQIVYNINSVINVYVHTYINPYSAT